MLTAMICSNALSSSNGLLLQATIRRLEDLGLQTLRTASTGDAEAAITLFAQFTDCMYLSFALEERWLNTRLSPDRDAHVREHTHLIELTVEHYMNFMMDDRLTCASIRLTLEEALLPHIVTRDRALLHHHHTVAP